MDTNYVLLTEKEAMWAELLMQVLRDNNIACVSQSVYGAGLTLKAGVKDRLCVFVPSNQVAAAELLCRELFSEQS